MQEDSELVNRLNFLSHSLPARLVEYGEALARGREQCEGESETFSLTDSQREEVTEILAALAEGRTGKDLPVGVPATEDTAVLAERVRALRERKKEVEEELELATEELTRRIGVGATVVTDDARVRVGAPRLTVRIKDAKLVPEEFLSLQPDRRAILDHVREAAQVPSGAEISETRPTIYFSKK